MLAKQFHPDSHAASLLTETHKDRLQEKFKGLNDSYNRLLDWIEERDRHLDQSLKDGTHPSGFTQKGDSGESEVTFKIGKI
jgi:DnaJ-class molecular chaperone